jgi:hypothetical protein
MYKSGQLGMCCTVEPNYSDISARLAGASLTSDRALNTCEPSYVPEATRPFFIHMVHSPLEAMGYMTAPEFSSRKGEARATWQHQTPSR